MKNEDLYVLFTTSSDKNPYYKLLFRALRGVDVVPLHESLPKFLPLTRSVLHNEDIDVIHLGWLYQFYMLRDFTPSSLVDTVLTVGRAAWFCIDLILVKLLGIQLVWTIHNKYHHERYYHNLERVLNVIVASLVDSITVKCDCARDIIVDQYHVRNESKITVIPDGNYIDAYPNEITEEQARSELGIPDDVFVYLFFGLIRPYKGVLNLLEKFHTVEYDNCSLWIVGNPHSESIRKQVEQESAVDPRVSTQLEFVSNEEVQYYMNAADVLILPYKDILNSGSVHLGLSFGMPVIAPAIGCIPETIPCESSLLYDPDAQDLDQVMSAIRDEDIEELQQKCLQQAESFTWEKSASQYKQVYERG